MKVRILRSIFALVFAFLSLPVFSQADSTELEQSRHSVFVSLGGSIIYTDVYDEYSAANARGGIDFKVGYDWRISKTGLGIGILYDAFYTYRKFWISNQYGNFPVKSSIFINIIAPQFVVDVARPTTRWAFTFKAGLGLATESDAIKMLYSVQKEQQTRCGVAVTLLTGAEYRINRHIGITATLANMSAYFGTFYDEEGFSRIDGMSNLSIDLGIKYRF